jgi:hypothetical protein
MEVVNEYVSKLEHVCAELPARATPLAVEVKGRRARIKGRVALNGTERFVSIFEVVEVDDAGLAHRRKYGYYLIEGRVERWGYDLDPTHDPEAHMHRGPSHERLPAPVVTVPDVIEKALPTGRGAQNWTCASASVTTVASHVSTTTGLRVCTSARLAA